jgi:hypothetical protein
MHLEAHVAAVTLIKHQHVEQKILLQHVAAKILLQHVEQKIQNSF